MGSMEQDREGLSIQLDASFTVLDQALCTWVSVVCIHMVHMVGAWKLIPCSRVHLPYEEAFTLGHFTTYTMARKVINRHCPTP